jgi:hypothetical protein
MLASRPSPIHPLTNSLPTRPQVRNFENRRIKSNNCLQRDQLGVSHRHVRSPDELPAMIIRIMRNQQYRSEPSRTCRIVNEIQLRGWSNGQGSVSLVFKS